MAAADRDASRRVVVGDSLPVLVGGREWSLPLVGTVDPTDPLARAGLGDVLLMDISGAQEVLDLVGGLTRVDLRLPESAEGDAIAAKHPSAARTG